MAGCDVEFEARKGGRPQRYCSPEHQSGGAKRRYWVKNRERISEERRLNRPAQAEKLCVRPGCGKMFVPVNRGDQSYCSEYCRTKVYHSTAKYRARAAAAQKRRSLRPERQAYIRTWRRRGMTDEVFLAKREAQDGRCAICRESAAVLVPDHDHATLAERGLLCRECNLGLGHFKDNPASLEAAIRYLASYKGA
jgi:Recombination endonuclease VII